MSNVTHYSYFYNNSILLEELIYKTGLMTKNNELPDSNESTPFLKDVKLEYLLKNYRIDTTFSTNSIEQTGGSSIKPVSTNPFALLNNENNNIPSTQLHQNTTINPNPIQILLIYEKSYQQYLIIYKYNDNFFVLDIQSNMAQCSDIKDKILNANSNFMYECDNVTYRNINYDGNLFKILSIKLLTKQTLDYILQYNPLIIKLVKHIKSENLCDIFIYLVIIFYRPWKPL